MEESWDVCEAHIARITASIGTVIGEGAKLAPSRLRILSWRPDTCGHAAVFPSANDRAVRQKAGPTLNQMIDFVIAGLTLGTPELLGKTTSRQSEFTVFPLLRTLKGHGSPARSVQRHCRASPHRLDRIEKTARGMSTSRLQLFQCVLLRAADHRLLTGWKDTVSNIQETRVHRNLVTKHTSLNR